MAKNSDGNSFAEIIERAQKVPEAPEGMSGLSDPSLPFPASSMDDIKVLSDSEGKGERSVEFDYEHHTRIFIFPGDEDKYDDLQNQLLKGDGLPATEERTVTKDGEFMLLKTWITRKKIKKAPKSPFNEEEE